MVGAAAERAGPAGAASLGRVQVLLAALLFSTGGAVIKACTLSSWQVAGLRSGVAAVTLLILVPEARRRWSARAAAVGAAYATTMVLYVLANKLTTAANTIFLQSSAPLYLLLLAPWILGEPVRGRDVRHMALLAVGVGSFFVGTPAPAITAPDPALGDVLAAASGLSWALTILGLRWLADAEGSGADVGGALVAGNVLAFVTCLPALLALDALTVVDGVLVGYLGTCQVGLAYLCLSRGVARVPALEASLLLLVEPVMNALWAWMIHTEVPGPLPLAGGGVILAATAWRARPG